MVANELSGVVEGCTVRVFVGGKQVGTGRLGCAGIADYQGSRLGATDDAHESSLAELTERLLEQGRREVEEMNQGAYDEDGVDVSLIRWSLSLTPRERLAAWEGHARFVAEGREAFRRAGYYVPENIE